MASDTSIGGRLKKRRHRMGFSLRELARRTDLTASFLSQVERGQANASLDSLRRIAEALNVSMLYFLSEPAEETPEPAQAPISPATSGFVGSGDSSAPRYDPVVRADARPQLTFTDSGVSYELLVPTLSRKMEVIRGEIPPGMHNVVRRLREPTEEFIYVLSGLLRVELKSGTHLLQPGDTIYFQGMDLLDLTAASDENAVWISVITPPVF